MVSVYVPGWDGCGWIGKANTTKNFRFPVRSTRGPRSRHRSRTCTRHHGLHHLPRKRPSLSTKGEGRRHDAAAVHFSLIPYQATGRAAMVAVYWWVGQREAPDAERQEDIIPCPRNSQRRGPTFARLMMLASLRNKTRKGSSNLSKSIGRSRCISMTGKAEMVRQKPGRMPRTMTQVQNADVTA